MAKFLGSDHKDVLNYSYGELKRLQTPLGRAEYDASVPSEDSQEYSDKESMGSPSDSKGDPRIKPQYSASESEGDEMSGTEELSQSQDSSLSVEKKPAKRGKSTTSKPNKKAPVKRKPAVSKAPARKKVVSKKVAIPKKKAVAFEDGTDESGEYDSYSDDSGDGYGGASSVVGGEETLDSSTIAFDGAESDLSHLGATPSLDWDEWKVPAKKKRTRPPGAGRKADPTKRKAQWSDKLKCEICGKMYTRSAKTSHNGSQFHKIYENANKRMIALLRGDF